VAWSAWAAYWAALPWVDCARLLYRFDGGLQQCTFGSPVPGNMPAWGFWPSLTLGVLYIALAVLVVSRRRPI